MTEFAIETKNLTKKYTLHKEAVKNISLKVPKGSVYVFLGRNGAGKTTTIRMLLGLLQKTSGEIEVLGYDPDKEPVAIKRKVGYVADNQKMYDWMSIGEIINFTRSFYPDWDDELERNLLEQFELYPKMKLKDLSRGMYSKVALLLALSHQPELLILDDPTSGLDPVVRRQFLQGIIEVIHQQERTVFFSTHIVTEVEQVADWVGIINDGELILSQPMEELKNSVKKIRLIFEDKVPKSVVFPNILKKETSGHEMIFTVKDFGPETLKSFTKFNPKNTEVLDLNLEEIFIALVGKNKN
ncbi:MAG: ABC transporter ATP-binding protein [Candidatus Omnitrophica bacterium]|nr:ABC transporter ATP-binding protein [Candidatus Omnitrophota bacterium]MBU1048006.1 ABC transporter ATP-binding protein [Candidatus Omnitrophota bacterium]MBU1631215.1 ABC transporter ATP-binding protein [Candidatus Omnitrophota bacterium]MBU1889376.1 ABC transporter ATP-binding protein [Candidatus Omnitrophota bacterium]